MQSGNDFNREEIWKTEDGSTFIYLEGLYTHHQLLDFLNKLYLNSK